MYTHLSSAGHSLKKQWRHRHKNARARAIPLYRRRPRNNEKQRNNNAGCLAASSRPKPRLPPAGYVHRLCVPRRARQAASSSATATNVVTGRPTGRRGLYTRAHRGPGAGSWEPRPPTAARHQTLMLHKIASYQPPSAAARLRVRRSTVQRSSRRPRPVTTHTALRAAVSVTAASR